MFHKKYDLFCFDFIYGSGIFDSDTGCDSK